nr:CooT family nickel-binding protein [uncultured Blautia sp.]
MCLATVQKESDNTVICKMVSRIDVDGDQVILRDIMGETKVIEGKILMVDLANSIVKLDCE